MKQQRFLSRRYKLLVGSAIIANFGTGAVQTPLHLGSALPVHAAAGDRVW